MHNRILSLGVLVCVLWSSSLQAAGLQAGSAIAGTIKDPAGAVVAGALVTATSETGEARTINTNEQGRFRIDNLKPGRYTVAVESKGFKRGEQAVVVEAGRATVVEIKLEIAPPTGEITIVGKGATAPNTEPGYRQVRDQESFETYSVTNLTLKRDVATITLHSGLISFAAPAMGRVIKAVFTGAGQFALTSATGIEGDYLRMITNNETVDESFEKAVFCFTDQTYDEIKRQAAPAGADQRAHDTLGDFNKRVRHRTERPRSFVEYLLAFEGENLDAELLTDLFNPKRSGCFNAFIFGKRYNDLRYLVRPRGALPQILSPEEVALINVDPGGEREGIWYLAHYEAEYRNGTASSEEDKRVIDVQHYRIETVIGGDEKLTASAEITFNAVGEGDRVVGFGLLPNLRVARVSHEGQEINFVQEPRKEDGSFYVVLPRAMERGKQYKLTVDYRGDKVVEDLGGGNFAVGARTSWYPSANAFNDRATFDLTFKVPEKYKLVGVGKLAREWKEQNYSASQWTSDVPLAVAGFNYGQFKKKEVPDSDTGYNIEGYATSELPNYLEGARNFIGGMTPSRMTENAMVEAQNSIRVFTHWFGKPPYGRIAITQQPQAFFGQSWPTLVYLPIIAFFDSTQRWMLMGGINSKLNDFIQEVTPHEVAHQWWGHMVGWASYHDQWLSEGFADFSAGLYLQATEKNLDKYMAFWKHARETIIEKNDFGKRANDAGPIWMGLRLNTFKNSRAYARLVYPKGGYILHMLRAMMWDNKSGDEMFMTMMKDFVQSNLNQNASTEGFKRMVEKHMTATMDLDGNKRMDWFFNEWVYGTELPAYKLVYSLSAEPDGKVMFTGTITQSGVSSKFKMVVPVYLDFGGKIVRLGEARIVGNSSTPEFKVRLPQRPKRVMINHYNDVLALETVNEQK
jgi:hypothetical protein